MKFLVNQIRKMISKIFLYSKIYSECFWLNQFLNKKLINTVLDVGANSGQYAMSLRRFGYKRKIISFEPGSFAHAKLLDNSKNDKNWHIYERIGLGNKKTIKNLNISKNYVSSSFRSINNIHVKHSPNSKYIKDEKSKILKLDSIFKSIYRKNDKVMLKIDTQGFEWEVLQGSKKSLKLIKVIQIELSFVELYKKQVNWLKIISYLEKNNFKIFKIIDGFEDKKNGQLFQSDFFFINTKYLK